MSISQSMTDSTKCFICQKKTKEKFRSNDEGWKSLVSLSPKFSTKNALSFDIKCIQIEGQDLEITLNNNNASYHHSCKNAYNNRMYKRLLGKEKPSSNSESKYIIKSPPTKQQFSTASNKVTSGQDICYLCNCIDKQENVVAAVTLYATKAKTQIDHVKGMRANWTEMAKVLQDRHLLI